MVATPLRVVGLTQENLPVHVPRVTELRARDRDIGRCGEALPAKAQAVVDELRCIGRPEHRSHAAPVGGVEGALPGGFALTSRHSSYHVTTTVT